MQTDFVHDPIHNNCHTCKISGILQNCQKQEHQQNVWQEHNNGTDTGNDSITDKRNRPGRHAWTKNLSDKHRGIAKDRFNPSDKRITNGKHNLEHQIHHNKEYRKTKPLVSNNPVDTFRLVFSSGIFVIMNSIVKNTCNIAVPLISEYLLRGCSKHLRQVLSGRFNAGLCCRRHIL